MALVKADILEEHIASIIRVTVGEPVTANIPSSLIVVTLMMEAMHSSKMSVLTRVTQRHIPEDGALQNKSNL
jgi:hypothetical protein